MLLFPTFGGLKKTISIMLLLCLLFTLVGHHIVFHFQQAKLKVEMRNLIRSSAKIDEEEIFVFSLTDQAGLSKLEWEEELEFRLDGKMYDVIEKKTEDGKLVIRCMNDKKETTLLKRLSEHWSDNAGANKIADKLFQILQTLFYEDVQKYPTREKSSGYYTLFLIHKLPQQIKNILTPPPQSAILVSPGC